MENVPELYQFSCSGGAVAIHAVTGFRFAENICRQPRAFTGNSTDFLSVSFRTFHLGRGATMGGIIYLVGLIVIILFILSFLGLR